MLSAEKAPVVCQSACPWLWVEPRAQREKDMARVEADKVASQLLSDRQARTAGSSILAGMRLIRGCRGRF